MSDLSADEFLGEGGTPPPPPKSADEFLDGEQKKDSGVGDIVSQALKPSIYMAETIRKAFSTPQDQNLGVAPEAVDAMKQAGEWDGYVKEHSAFHTALDDQVMRPTASDLHAAFIRGGSSPFVPIAKGVPEGFKAGWENLKNFATMADMPTPVLDEIKGKAERGEPVNWKDYLGSFNEAFTNSPAGQAMGAAFNPVFGATMPAFQEATKLLEDAGIPHQVTEAIVNLSPLAGVHGMKAKAEFAPTEGPWGTVERSIATAKANDVIGVTESQYMGTQPLTDTQLAARNKAAAELPEVKSVPQPTVHDIARQIAPKVFSEYDALSTQRETIGRWIRELKESDRQRIEEESPFAKQIATLEESKAGGSKRQQKIAQEKIDDLTEKHDAWVAENAPKISRDMQNLLDAYQKADYRMRDMAPGVSKAYRSAEERMPAEAALAKPEVKEITPQETKRETFAKEAKGAKGKEKAVLTRAASKKINPDKVIEDAAWAKENNRPDIVEALTEKARQATDSNVIKERFPQGISGHVEKELTKVGRPAEEAKLAAQLIEAHYKARSDRFKGLRGTPEEMYARDSAVIKAGRQTVKAKARELAQSETDQMLRDALHERVMKEIKIRDKEGFMKRAAEGTLTSVERRLPDDLIRLADHLRDSVLEQGKSLFQPGDYGLPGFYSKMYRTLGEQLNAKGTPEQMLQQIQSMAKNGKFKQDELYWSGIEDYLKDLPKDQKVSKEELMDWLDRNKLEVNEHMLDKEGDQGGFTDDDVSFGGAERVDVETESPDLFKNEVNYQIERFHEDHGDDAQAYFEKEGEPENDPFIDIEENADGTKKVTWNDEAIHKDAEENARASFEESGETVEEVTVGHGAHDYKIYIDENAGSWRITDDSGLEIHGSDRHPEERAREAMYEHLFDNDIIHHYDENEEYGSTKYSDYQSEGPKEDYRELLITLPQISDKGVSQHGWPSEAENDNILLHTRFNSRIDAEGKKTLFIEEIQSDWHQQGRKKGYANEEAKKKAGEILAEKKDAVEAVLKRLDNLGFETLTEAKNAIKYHNDWASRWEIKSAEDVKAIEEYREAYEEGLKSAEGVANAPFADLNKYSELAMKRLIGFAAEHGFEKVAWTTGEQQAERWSGALQRHVQEIRVSPDSTPEALKIKVVRAGGTNVSDFIAKQAKGASYDEATGYLTIKPEEIGTIFGKGIQDEVLGRANAMREKPPEKPYTDEEYTTARDAANKARNDWLEGRYDENLTLDEKNALSRVHDEAEANLAKIVQAMESDSVIDGLDMKVSDKGMKEVYDKVLVNTANSIIKKYGAKVKAANIDTGAKKLKITDGTVPTAKQIRAKFEDLMKEKTAANLGAGEDINAKWSITQEDQVKSMARFLNDIKNKDEKTSLEAAFEHESRYSDVMRDAFGITVDRKPAPTEQWSFDMTPELKKSAEEGQTLFQGARGKIRLADKDAKAAITLFKAADASTFIHETGHHWLDELMRDAAESNAPKDLLADAKTVREWLGVKDGEEIATRQHEKFARGFERYLMEGVAPTRELANVFAKFKQWLTDIYKTVQKLRSPISDDIRHVFDRLLTTKPEKTVIAPDSEAGKMMADIHELDAKHTPPEHAAAMGDNVEGEIDKTAYLHDPEVYDALKKAESGEAGSIPQTAPGATGSGAEPAQPTTQQPPAISAGSGGSEGEGAGQRAKETVDRTSPGVSEDANAVLPRPESKLIDKAGNIRLDNLNTPEDVNHVLRDAADERGGFVDARRGVISDSQALELADALGMDPAMLNMRKIGQAYSAEQIIAARKLLIQSATSLRDVMKKAATGDENDVMAYAQAKARHMMIQEQVSGITAEAGRALRAFRELEGSKETKLMGEFLRDTTGKDLFQLQEEAKLGAQLDTPQKLSKFINDSKKASFMDMVVEYWINALLSGPKTHVANVLSNSLVALYSIPESIVAAGVGKVLKSADRVVVEEAKGKMFGLLQGAQDGVVAAWNAFKNEATSDDAMKVEQRKFQAIPSAKVNIGGKEREIGGKQVRLPGRMLAAEDEFFKSIASRQELNALAYRQAVKEGLKGDAMANRVADIVLNPSEDMMKQAAQAAKYQTFTKDLGKTGKAIQRFANSHPLLKFVIPFIRTPTNIVKYAGERTPFGLLSSAVRENLSGRNGTVARDQQISRMALGSSIGLATIMMAQKGQVTGGGPTDPRQLALLRQTGWQPYSIKIGDMYYSYNRFEPLGTILGVSADMTEISEAISKVDAEKLVTMVMAAISKNLTSKTWLQGPSDLIQAVSDPDRYGGSYVKKFVGTIIPSAVAQAAQTMDPVMRDARTMLDGIKARVPGMSQGLFPRRDVWGEPIVKEGSAGPDILSPIYESSAKPDPVNQRLLALKVYPSRPERKIRGVELTAQQYDDYTRLSGRMAKLRLNGIVSTQGFASMPEGAQIDIIKKTLDQTREAARSIIMMQNPEIIRKATDTKLQTLRGPNAQHSN